MALTPSGYVVTVTPTIHCKFMTTTENPAIETIANSSGTVVSTNTFNQVWDSLTKQSSAQEVYTINYQTAYMKRKTGDTSYPLNNPQICYPIFNGGTSKSSANQTWDMSETYSFSYPNDKYTDTLSPGQIGRGAFGSKNEETVYFVIGANFEAGLSDYDAESLITEPDPRTGLEDYSCISQITCNIADPDWISDQVSWYGTIKYENCSAGSLGQKFRILCADGDTYIDNSTTTNGTLTYSAAESKKMKYLKSITCSGDTSDINSSGWSAFDQVLEIPNIYTPSGPKITAAYRIIYIFKFAAFEGLAVAGIKNHTRISIENFRLSQGSARETRTFWFSFGVQNNNTGAQETTYARIPFNSAFGVPRAQFTSKNYTGVSVSDNSTFGFSSVMFDLGNRITSHELHIDISGLVSDGPAKSYYLGYSEHNWRYYSPSVTSVRPTLRYNNRDIHLYFFGDSPSRSSTDSPPSYIESIQVSRLPNAYNYDIGLWDPLTGEMLDVVNSSDWDKEFRLIQPVIDTDEPDPREWDYFGFPVFSEDIGSLADGKTSMTRSGRNAYSQTSMLGKIYTISPDTSGTGPANRLDTDTGNITGISGDTAYWTFKNACKVVSRRRYSRPPVGSSNPSGYYDFHTTTTDNRISRFTVRLLGDGLYCTPRFAEDSEAKYTYAYRYRIFCHFFYFDKDKDESGVYLGNDEQGLLTRKISVRSDFPVLYTESGEENSAITQEELAKSRICRPLVTSAAPASNMPPFEAYNESDPDDNTVLYGIMTRGDNTGRLEFVPGMIALQTPGIAAGTDTLRQPMSVKQRNTQVVFSDDLEYPFEIFVDDDSADFYEANPEQIPGLHSPNLPRGEFNVPFTERCTGADTGKNLTIAYIAIESN